ncbi:MAG: GNAT family N-acetyltransferase [Planctomycetota bacterium]|nr:GNAT family N-acetyltransferase [Planctomycetota bacterium]
MSEFSVHACGPPDRTAQARLFNACFKKATDAAGLAWRYDGNPHGAALSFVQRTADGTAVSGYACSPRRAVPGGDEARAAIVGETGDVMTHPEWRKRGLFSALDRAAMAESKRRGWPLVFGLPNRRSAHIFLELGWERVGTLRPWTFVVRADAAARAERAKEGRVRGWLAPLAARAGRAARTRLRASVRLQGRRLSAFPPEVADLSRRVEPRFSLMVRRDADYLDWRFLRGSSGLHRAIGLYAGERFAGYVVVQVPRPGESVGYLVDLLAEDDAGVAAALEAGLAELEGSGAAVVQATAIDGSWWNEVLAVAGFQPPKPDNHLTVIVHVHDAAHPLGAAARDPRRWYLTDGDRDDETMG